MNWGTILSVDTRRQWAIHHLGPGVRMASQTEHATVTTPVRTVTPFIGPETAEEAGYLDDLPPGYGTSGYRCPEILDWLAALSPERREQVKNYVVGSASVVSPELFDKAAKHLSRF